jgi:CIC family chloride channel protein
MAGLIAGVIHAPLTAIFLIAEVTGGHTLIVPLMITAAISFLITRNALDYTIYTKELAKIGALLTHNKDQMVLGMLEMEEVIEENFIPVHPKMSLGEMLHNSVSRSNRNIFPVLDEQGKLLGIVLLDDIRPFMFDTALYDTVYVHSLMHNPPELLFMGEDSMKEVMKKFQQSGAWNLPVIKDGKYAGFVSKSKLLTAYRKKLINNTQ